MIEDGAKLERTVVRGPAIIGAGTRISDSYIGPYTAIDRDVVITGSEVEHSIVLAGSSIRDLARPDGGEPARQERQPEPQRGDAQDPPLPGGRQRGHLDPVKVLVTGAGGMLGHDVVRVAEDMRHQVLALTHDDLDVTDPAKVERLITRERPGAVINCAAWTNVDGARGIRARGLRGQRARAPGSSPMPRPRSAPSSSIPRPTTSSTGPAGPTANPTIPIRSTPTGATKLAGERATALVNGRSFIVRTSWLFGPARRQLRRDDAAARSGRRARWWSSTTRSAAPPIRATSRSACCA